MAGPGRGGYRRPNNPASVSGPGSMSQRTDGRVQAPKDIPSNSYGDAKDFQQIQQGAPMAATAPTPSAAPAAQGPSPLQQLPGFGDPSARPDEPTTAGAAMGAGPGPDSLGLPQPDSQAAAKQIAPLLPTMIRVANGPYGTPELKQYIRAVIAAL